MSDHRRYSYWNEGLYQGIGYLAGTESLQERLYWMRIGKLGRMEDDDMPEAARHEYRVWLEALRDVAALSDDECRPLAKQVISWLVDLHRANHCGR